MIDVFSLLKWTGHFRGGCRELCMGGFSYFISVDVFGGASSFGMETQGVGCHGSLIVTEHV